MDDKPLSPKFYKQLVLTLFSGAFKSWAIHYLLWHKEWRKKVLRRKAEHYLAPAIFLRLISELASAELDSDKKRTGESIEWAFINAKTANETMGSKQAHSLLGPNSLAVSQEDLWFLKEALQQLGELPSMMRQEVRGDGGEVEEYAEMVACAVEKEIQGIRERCNIT